MNHLLCCALRKVLILSFLLISTQAASADQTLWAALDQGGKVVLIRHAQVVSGPDAGNPLQRDPSCESERMLSTDGKQNAQLLGRQFSQRGIPIDEVLHSPYCRTTDTARLAFGEARAEQYLSLLEVLEAEAAQQQTQTLSQVIGSYAGEGNLVLVSHEPNIRAVSFELMKHLDILVIEPLGGTEFEELGVIRFTGD
jgi:phosphohistidine phosphatase SixA